MSRLGIKIIVSERMSQRGGEENSLIRLPKKAREYFDFKKHKIGLGNGSSRTELRIKESYKEDITLVSKDDRYLIGFVTSANYEKLIGDSQEKFWVTEEGEPLMLGCDPEFALVVPSSGEIEYASSILDGRYAPFGSDGTLAEIRPDPAQEVETLIENIRRLFQRPPTKAKEYDWIGGATYKDNYDYHSIGGHIHIGNPDLGTIPNENMDRIILPLAILLDDCIGTPLVKIDRPSASKRRQSYYGGYLKYRTEHGRLEWRTPSGYWLVHPDIASAVLGTAKAVAETFWDRTAREKGMGKSLSITQAHEDKFLSTFNIRFCPRTRDILNSRVKLEEDEVQDSLQRLKNIEHYGMYRKYIDKFSDIVCANETDLDEVGLDIKANWLG